MKPEECTVDEWLDLAERSEKIKNDCGPFDSTSVHFIRERDAYLKMACEREILDRGGK
jgi:hypothetical protein